MEFIIEFKAVILKHIDQCLASGQVLNITVNSIYVNDLFRIVVFNQVERQISYTVIILCLDAGHVRNFNFKRKHWHAGSLKAGTYTFLFIRKIVSIGKHDRAVKSSGIRKMEDIQLAFVLQFMIARAAIRDKHKKINTVFLCLSLYACNYMFNKLVTETVCEYSYAFVHLRISQQVQSSNRSYPAVSLSIQIISKYIYLI